MNRSKQFLAVLPATPGLGIFVNLSKDRTDLPCEMNMKNSFVTTEMSGKSARVDTLPDCGMNLEDARAFLKNQPEVLE